jgi:hypothetical protein
VTSLERRIDGVLGQSFLRRLDYLIDYDRGELVPHGAAVCGSALPLHDVEGRPAIQAQIDGAPRMLVIDSGAPALILFGGRSHQTALVSTNAGQTRATVGMRVIRIGERKYRLMTAEVAGDRNYGLLPARAFRSLYVNNSEGYVVLGDRAQSGSCSGSSGRSG